MRNIKHVLLILGLFLSLNTNSFAQKYGHLNLGNFLASLTESKVANDELVKLQENMKNSLQKDADALKVKADAFQKEFNAGNLTRVQAEQQQAAIEEERQGILKKEQDDVQKLQEKRQELLEPILKKVEDAIKAVAKENGYVMIFDTSLPGTIMYLDQKDNIAELVKKKMESM